MKISGVDVTNEILGIFAGLIPFTLGLLSIYAPELMERIIPGGIQGKERKQFGWVVLGFSLIVISAAFVSMYLRYTSITPS